MKTPTPHISKTITLIATSAAFLLPAAAADRSLTEFAPQENEKLRWQVVDDGVMGGLSKGKLSFTDSGTLRFSGRLSLENNGGFSSLRTGDLNLDLSTSKGFALRVRGDGRSYQLRVASDARYRGMEVSFMGEFPTEKDQWTVVRVPFGELTGSFRGRSLKDEVLNTADIRRLGLLLADKKPGAFALEVDWIRAYDSDGNGTIIEQALADGRFKTLAAALTKAQLVSLLEGEGPFTVFAPTDEAFSQLPDGTVESLLEPANIGRLQAILKYHVSPGATGLAAALEAGSAATAQGDPLAIAFRQGRVRINDAAVLDADIACSNGVIHVIDSVLLPPAPAEQAKDILGVARRAGNFTTLIAAVEAAGLTEALKENGPFTVLAPTDEAFAALPAGTVDQLLKPGNIDRLKAVLTYHAIPGAVSAGDALNAGSAKTLNGLAVKFTIQNGVFQVNGTTIRSTDISCSNGLIHVIDAVLLPPSDCPPDDCDKAPTAASPGEIIEDAIDRGVPVFNHGDHGQCAAIYQLCLQTLAVDQRIDAGMRKTLTKILDHADRTKSDRERAWIYRGALDRLYPHVAKSSCQ